MSIKHAFVSAKADGADTTLVRPSNWNAAHSVPNETCLVNRNAVQSIPNDTWTALLFNSEIWDSNDIHDLASNTSRLTCKSAGKYFVWFNFCWDSNTTGRRGGSVLKNGATNEIHAEVAINAGAPFGWLGASGIIDLAVNDYIELQVHQNSGGALNVYWAADSVSPRFGMHRLI